MFIRGINIKKSIKAVLNNKEYKAFEPINLDKDEYHFEKYKNINEKEFIKNKYLKLRIYLYVFWGKESFIKNRAKHIEEVIIVISKLT